MAGSHWKDAFLDLLDFVSLRRLTARVALSAGLLGLAAQAPDAAAGPRVPVTPAFNPEVTVRKFRGRYVLKRTAASFAIHLAGHRSHSSHSSHRSHSSHSSSSHYSGSHFSSSPTPPPRSAPEPVPVPAPVPQPRVYEAPPPPPKPAPLLQDDFLTTSALIDRWIIGVLATVPATFDPAARVEIVRGALTIAPAAGKEGAHFSGCVSRRYFDLSKAAISVQLRRPADSATTLFAAAMDAANWIGFRIEGGRLTVESHNGGKVISHAMTFDAARHRFLRLRATDIAHIIVWETSADGVQWNAPYAETASIPIDALRIALSAGTTRRVESPGTALFDGVTVEPVP